MAQWTFALLLAVAGASRLAAQQDPHACVSSPELDPFYREQVRNNPNAAENIHQKLAGDPDNVFLNRWYLDSMAGSVGAAVDEYRRKLEQHPDDPRYLYFYGRALIGAHTREAIETLDRAIARDPLIPWTYSALIEVYSAPNFRDSAKLGDATRHLSQVCPDELGAFNRLNMVENLETVRELAARFRAALERRNTSGVPAYYPTLWAAEARLAGPDGAAKMRERVAADLPRIKQLNPDNHRAQQEAYKILGDTAMVKELGTNPEAPTPGSTRIKAGRTVDGWLSTHAFPGGNATAEEKARFEQEAASASESWVRDFPEEPHAWSWRFQLLAMQKRTSNEEIGKLGDQTVAVARRHPEPWSQWPEILGVAQEWEKRGIRLAECIQLAAESLELIRRVPPLVNDLWNNGLVQSHYEATTLAALFRAYEVQAGAALKLKDYTKVTAVIAAMKDWLDHNRTENPGPFATYSLAQARLADARGRTIDALAFYQRAIQTGRLDAEVLARARTLWEQQGGSSEALEAFLTRTPDPQAWADWYEPASRWARVDKSLDGLNAKDLNGRVWSAADLKGKTTLIAAWATWCGPCVAEMAEIEKLRALIQDRKDMQVITFNIDENAALAPPFVKQHGLTVAVIPAPDLVKTLMPHSGIPCSWLVDAEAHVRLESTGFDPRFTNWAQDMLDRLQLAAEQKR
jgi:tetratricopeptide (TPR) repeat protein